jgi:hypothetical protein
MNILTNPFSIIIYSDEDFKYGDGRNSEVMFGKKH